MLEQKVVLAECFSIIFRQLSYSPSKLQCILPLLAAVKKLNKSQSFLKPLLPRYADLAATWVHCADCHVSKCNKRSFCISLNFCRTLHFLFSKFHMPLKFRLLLSSMQTSLSKLPLLRLSFPGRQKQTELLASAIYCK